MNPLFKLAALYLKLTILLYTVVWGLLGLGLVAFVILAFLTQCARYIQ